MSAQFRGQGNRVTVGGRTVTWAALAPGEGVNPIAVLDDGHERAFRAVRRHLDAGTELLVASTSRVDGAMRAELRNDGFHVLSPSGHEAPDHEAPGTARVPVPGRVWILTSGTTGRPKRVSHTLRSLTTVSTEQPPRVWLCPYSPGTYAWWQLVTLSIAVPGQEIVAVDPDRLDGWPALAAEHGVTAVSGTPTFWRQALLRDGDMLAGLPLRQVTLGGEPVDQAILDRLAEMLPTARISWIYASSEVGAAVAVHDGRAGFPGSWLGQSAPGRPALFVEDGELVIASPHAGAGFEGRIRTGDRVELVDGRVMITGRLGSDEINVGGMKVSSGMVRDVLLAHGGVRWARVTARRAPILGSVVVAEVVTDGSIGDEDVRRWAAARLPGYAVPRRIHLLEEIPMKESLKSDV